MKSLNELVQFHDKFSLFMKWYNHRAGQGRTWASYNLQVLLHQGEDLTDGSINAGKVLIVPGVGGSQNADHANGVLVACSSDLLWRRHKAGLGQIHIAWLDLRVQTLSVFI